MGRERFADMTTPSGAAVVIGCKCGEAVRLLLHFDAKTSPGVHMATDSRGRVQAKATVPNAFPLPAGPLESGGSCPGVTSECKNCYAAGLETWSKPFALAASGNLEGLQHLHNCGGRRAVVRALVVLVRHSAALQRGAGVRRPSFRWQSDGDIFSSWYGAAIRQAAVETPEIDHWLYTRSLSLVRYLMPAPRNLSVYVSADSENVRAAVRVASKHGLPVAMLAADTVEAAALWARAAAVGVFPSPVLCPASGQGKYAQAGDGLPAHVVGPDGKRATLKAGGAAVGACIACGVCLPGGASRSVTFTVHGGRAAAGSPGRLGAVVRVRVQRQRDREGASHA